MKKTPSKLSSSFVYAWRGIVWNLAHERNMKIHLVSLLLCGYFGFLFQLTLNEWLILLVFFALIPSLELVNSAVEDTCNCLRDNLQLDYQATKLPRDLAAGAVLWASVFAALAGAIIFLPKIYFSLH